MFPERWQSAIAVITMSGFLHLSVPESAPNRQPFASFRISDIADVREGGADAVKVGDAPETELTEFKQSEGRVSVECFLYSRVLTSQLVHW